jgi:gliding motility-associated-like protein
VLLNCNVMAKKIRIWITFLFIPFLSFATHVVGGSLTYVYNGGSNYTITLKLYRDCGAGTAALPGSVTIQIVGNNGLPFTPSKNVTINLTSVTNIAASLNPCAIPPNPAPCVEEAIYTTTVNNLPPNPGGYHMYFQICCRNGSILNITNPGAAGESFYANIPGMSISSIWNEDFALPNNTTIDNGATSWSITPGTIAPSSVGVTGNIFQIAGANNASETWSSQVVSIASCGSASLSVDLAESGTLEPNDSIIVYYRLNGGPLIPFPVNGIKADDFTSAIATASGLIGTTIQIVIRVHFDGASPNSEIYSFDNVNITCIGNNFIPNSNPVFNLFPPLFICVNQPFTFNHSATDVNGDSLVYSLYQPYNNTAPTFTNNTASFTPITYVGGYTSTNPLGAGSFSINPSTGLLTGTPGTQGQFVVGVMVKEYRNGVYIGETLRDFQFNVVNCPQPPPTLAVPNATINNGCSAKLTATGISSVSATWTSISPGIQGAYNNYLACTSGCLNNTVTPVGTPPAFVDFLVCGISTSCAGTFICDTFRITFNPTLGVSIIPLNPTLCFGQTSTTITANGSGGTPPYSYLWNNINPSQTISVGVGTYNVKLTDASGCPPVFNTVSVTAFSVAISANAGPNQTKCIQNPLAILNGTVTGASGGIWSGGTGAFIPNNTTLSNVTYSPTSAEITSGFVNLYLTTTGNGTCPSKQDTIKINYSGFTGIATPTIINISCYGGTNGSATFGISGGFTPYSYLWNTAPTQTTSIINNLTIGTYSVTIKDGIGCTYQTSVTITQPTPLAVSGTTINVSCNGGSNGSITSAASGGTTPYTYLWSVGGQTTSAISGLPAGTYSLTVTDDNGCQKTTSYSITQPLPIAITFTSTQVSCFNTSNGTINSNVTGGTSSYTYSWSPNGASAPSITGLSAGTYTLLVTDNFSCTASNSITITQPTALTITTSVINETCDYLNNGSASVTPNGGTAPYSYSWSPGAQTTASISNLSSGTYSVIVNDNKGCSSLALIAVTQPPTLTVGIVNQINVSCFGGNDGSVGATPAGGTPNYTYSWTPNNSSSASVNSLPIGTYTITIKDSKACIATNTVTIIQPTALVASVSSISITCNGGSDGSVSSVASGGTASYTYTWMPGNITTQTISNLTAGTYTVKVTDNKGCLASNTVTIIEPTPILPVTSSTNSTCGFANGIGSVSVSGGYGPYTYSWTPSGGTGSIATGLLSAAYNVYVTDTHGCLASEYLNINDSGGPIISIYSTTNVSCNGGNDGSATAAITGGQAPFSYTWTPSGGNGLTTTGLTAGLYYITVSDVNGCQSLATTNPIISEPTPITVNFITSNVSCYSGTNGSATVTANGGAPGYTYTWLPSASTGSIVTGLSANSYSVQVKDLNNCIQTATYAIAQPTAAVSISVSSTSTSCFGGSNGSASAIVSGGTAPYNYNWMTGNFSSPSISNLSMGTYSITVTDNKNCVTTNTINVIQPTSIVLTTGSSNSNCSLANGQASVTASGGMGTYTYSWSPTGGSNSTASGLLAGSYTITVLDGNSCPKVATQLVLDNPTPTITIASSTSVSCNGGSDGTATASVTGGIAPYTYTWSPSGGNGITGVGLATGTYTVITTANNGCQAIAITSLIPQPSIIFITTTTSNVSCFTGANGSATVSAGGGTPGYTYTWLPSASTGSTIAGLSANIYSIQVKDSHNCIQNATYAISQPTAAVSISVSSTSVSCFGGSNGSASAIASGGTAPYSYTWSPVTSYSYSVTGLPIGTYTVNVKDSKGCASSATIGITQPTQSLSATGNGVPTSCSGGSNGTASVSPTGGMPSYTYSWAPTGGTGQSAAGLSPGNYVVVVSDINNCQINVPIIIGQPTAVSCTLIPINAACNNANGSISSQVTGGTGPYNYLWSSGSITTPVITGLLPGTYSLQITDAANCLSNYTTSLINVPGPSIVLSSTVNDSCFGGNNGKATVTLSQGTAPLSVNWLPYGGNSLTASLLVAGIYTANVTDARGCQNAITASITEPNPISISINSITNVSCFNGNNGSITVGASGGTPTYSYSWSPSGVGSTISNLTAGSYTVSVKDSHLCRSSISMGVSQPLSPLTSTISGVNLLCFNSSGSASSSASGGTGPYTYTWTTSPPQNGSTALNIASGPYTVTISDANGCSTTNSITITRPTSIISNAGVNDTICLGQMGTLTASATGGAGNYYYVWQPVGITNSGTLTVSPTSTSIYTVVAFDQNGCAGSSDTVKAIVFSLTSANIQTFGLSPICPGQSSVISALVSGNTGPVSYNWNYGLGNGPGPYIVTPTQPTNYVITVSNSCGISILDSVIITFNPPPTILASISGTLNCIPTPLSFFDNSLTGNINDPISNWLWDFGDGTTSNSQNPNHVYNTAGTYSVNLTVTTDAGCTSNNGTSPIVVYAYPNPVASFTINSNLLNLPYDVLVCTNQSTGAITYNWNFGDGNTSTSVNPSYLYTSVGEYLIQLIATSSFGCIDTAYAHVITDADIVFPNAFTPNTSGSSGGYYDPKSIDNDIFFPYSSGVIDFKFQIFDRWGELIFETDNIKQGWDGYYRDKPCQVGVYVWKAYAKLNNGKIFNKTGDVTLLK